MVRPSPSTVLEKETAEVYKKQSKAGWLSLVWRKLKKSRLAVVGGGIVLLAATVAVLGPMIAPYDPSQMFYGDERLPPSTKYWFGTDRGGRDVFSWVVWGTRVSLYVGLAAVSIELLIGVTVGMIAGYFGGIIDEVLMRLTDVILNLPTMMLIILAVTMFQVRSVNIIIMIMGLLGWTFLARVVRSEFLSLKETTFVEAARSMGAGSWRIMLRHILPNLLSIVIVLVTMDLPWYIMEEATLAFMGLGDPTQKSWGQLVSNGFPLLRSAWWVTTFPGLALTITSLAFNLFGDGLRDALDVKTRA